MNLPSSPKLRTPWGLRYFSYTQIDQCSLRTLKTFEFSLSLHFRARTRTEEPSLTQVAVPRIQSGEMNASTPVCQITWARSDTGCTVLERQVQAAETWVAGRGVGTEERQVEWANRKWHALASRYRCVSSGSQAFPGKNKDAQTGEADSWMYTDAEKCPHWKMTTLHFHSLTEYQSSLGEPLFLCLESSCCVEIHTYAWRLNVDIAKLQKLCGWAVYRTFQFSNTPMIIIFLH